MVFDGNDINSEVNQKLPSSRDGAGGWRGNWKRENHGDCSCLCEALRAGTSTYGRPGKVRGELAGAGHRVTGMGCVRGSPQRPGLPGSALSGMCRGGSAK